MALAVIMKLPSLVMSRAMPGELRGRNVFRFIPEKCLKRSAFFVNSGSVDSDALKAALSH